MDWQARAFFLAFAVGIPISALLSWMVRRATANARSWPQVIGTVESGAIERVGCEQDGPTIDLPTFRFSYKVGDSYYAGRFALEPLVEDPQKSILLSMAQRKVQVHYDPERPEVYLLHDEVIDGCKVVEMEFEPWIARLKG